MPHNILSNRDIANDIEKSLTSWSLYIWVGKTNKEKDSIFSCRNKCYGRKDTRKNDQECMKMKVKLFSCVWLFATPCSLSGSSVHGILKARRLEWVAISFSRGSSQPRDRTQVSHIAGRHFTIWATREDLHGRNDMERKDTRKNNRECIVIL